MDCVKWMCEKIGFGFVLSWEVDGVWLYNCFGYLVFVNLFILDNFSLWVLVVIKVNFGYFMNIFNYDMVSVFWVVKEWYCLDGLYDLIFIRISFVKGWGFFYYR